MTTEPNQEASGEEPGSNSKSSPAGCLVFIPILFLVTLIMAGIMALTAAAHPYTGTGVVKSHTPWGSALCLITVVESDGSEYAYQKSGGLPYCQGVEDGSKVQVERGTITTITAP